MSESGRPKYSTAHPCPKCGSFDVGTSYDDMMDALARRCHRCSYRWSEDPLDRAPTPDRAVQS